MKEYKKLSVEFTLQSKKTDLKAVKVTNAQDAVQYARHFYGSDINIFESVFAIMLNQAGNTIGFAKISQGGIGSSIVDRVIFCKYAVESLASSVIMVHNHPSGNTRPSNIDRECTIGLVQSLKILGIKMLDSIILTENDYYSFNEHGEM